MAAADRAGLEAHRRRLPPDPAGHRGDRGGRLQGPPAATACTCPRTPRFAGWNEWGEASPRRGPAGRRPAGGSAGAWPRGSPRARSGTARPARDASVQTTRAPSSARYSSPSGLVRAQQRKSPSALSIERCSVSAHLTRYATNGRASRRIRRSRNLANCKVRRRDAPCRRCATRSTSSTGSGRSGLNGSHFGPYSTLETAVAAASQRRPQGRGPGLRGGARRSLRGRCEAPAAAETPIDRPDAAEGDRSAA